MKTAGFLKQSLRRALEQKPIIGHRFSQMRLRRQYPAEWALIYGQQPYENPHASFLRFSVNNEVTQYVMELLSRVGQENAVSERRVYQQYSDWMVSRHTSLLLTRYEDITQEFDAWFTRLLDHCQFEISEGLKQTIHEKAEKIRPDRKDILAHVRQGRPGDHQNKLHPNTIERLNETFFKVLKDFNYA